MLRVGVKPFLNEMSPVRLWGPIYVCHGMVITKNIIKPNMTFFQAVRRRPCLPF
jgi:hypothetical protein